MNFSRVITAIAIIAICAGCTSRHVEKRKVRDNVWIRTIDINCSDCERVGDENDPALKNTSLAHGGIIASTKDIADVWLATEKNRDVIFIFIRRESAGRVKSAEMGQMGQNIVVINNETIIFDTKLEEDISQALVIDGLSHERAKHVFDSITNPPAGVPN